MRQRQSSVTTDTQFPVRSIGAAARGVGGIAGCPRCPAATPPLGSPPTRSASANSARLLTSSHHVGDPDGMVKTSPPLTHVPICSFNEHLRRPGPRGGAVPAVVLERRSGRLHLLQRPP